MIKALDKNTYKGHKLLFRYTTNSYYKVTYKETKDTFIMSLTKHTFENIKQKSFTSTLFESYLDAPSAFGFFMNNALIGCIEVNKETWHNVLRVTNILIDENHRRQGIGKKLMNYVKRLAKDENYRLILLETQTCNIKAIDFYRNQGFTLIGLNLADYTNHDIEKNEVRLEFGYKIHTQ